MNSHEINGKEMRHQLQSVGVQAQKVVRKRDTGFYTADFYEAEMRAAIPSAREWAQRIQRTFPSKVIIHDTRDTHADWRPGNPIIFASVTFEIAA